MLEYDRINISEGIFIDKTDAPKESDIMQKAINFNDVAVVSVKGSYYRIHF